MHKQRYILEKDGDNFPKIREWGGPPKVSPVIHKALRMSYQLNRVSRSLSLTWNVML
jgi:hypothetical protein